MNLVIFKKGSLINDLMDLLVFISKFSARSEKNAYVNNKWNHSIVIQLHVRQNAECHCNYNLCILNYLLKLFKLSQNSFLIRILTFVQIRAVCNYAIIECRY